MSFAGVAAGPSANRSRYGDLGRLQLQLVENVLPHLNDRSLPLSGDDKRSITETLISSSHFGGMRWKLTALKHAQRLIDHTDSPLLAKWAHRNDCVHRMYNMAPMECQLSCSSRLQDPESISIFAAEVTKTAYLQLQNNKLEEALKTIQQFRPLDNPSELQKVVVAKVALERGRILQCLGRWEESLLTFLDLYNSNEHLPTPSLCRLVSYMTGLWCETDLRKKA